MLRLFTIIRIWIYTAVIASSAIVLGFSANFATKFLPDLHRDGSAFSLPQDNTYDSLLQVTLSFILSLRRR